MYLFYYFSMCINCSCMSPWTRDGKKISGFSCKFENYWNEFSFQSDSSTGKMFNLREIHFVWCVERPSDSKGYHAIGFCFLFLFFVLFLNVSSHDVYVCVSQHQLKRTKTKKPFKTYNNNSQITFKLYRCTENIKRTYIHPMRN